MQQQAVSEFPIDVGERVGLTYQVRGFQGADAECRVYEAQDVVLRRGVVLKVTDREHRARVVREAQALAAIHAAELAHGGLDARSVLVCPSDRVVLLGVRAIGAAPRADDVRAFGRIAYQLLTGITPQDGEHDAAALRPDVPHVLADLVQQCIAGTIEMADVAAELRAIPRKRPRRPSQPPGY